VENSVDTTKPHLRAVFRLVDCNGEYATLALPYGGEDHFEDTVADRARIVEAYAGWTKRESGVELDRGDVDVVSLTPVDGSSAAMLTLRVVESDGGDYLMAGRVELVLVTPPGSTK